jgi:tRNA A37 methylthiotransferase MiaB
MSDSVPAAEKARREKVLTDILARTGLADNEKYIGQEVIVLADGVDAHGRLYGKTSSYKTVFFSSELAPRKLIGRFVIIKIEAARTFGLSGTFVRLAEAD